MRSHETHLTWIDQPRIPHHWTRGDSLVMIACVLAYAWRFRKLMRAIDSPE